MKEDRLSIWFLIGLQLVIMGAIITIASIFDLIYPGEDQSLLANLHPGIYWGVLMLSVGIFYTVKFGPKWKTIGLAILQLLIRI